MDNLFSAKWREWSSLYFEYLKCNLAQAIEYKTSSFSQILGMFINDFLWVAFWLIYFKKFPILNGWTVNDVLAMWSVITLSFGIQSGLFLNLMQLPQIITQGQLDYYLNLPRPVLPHLAMSKISYTNLGDMVFGLALFFLIDDISMKKFFIYLMVAVLGSLIYASFIILIGSLSFFIGNSDSISSNLLNALVHFSTYPTKIFTGWTRVLLFTLIPAGFLCEVPVELLKKFNWNSFILLMSVAMGLFGIAIKIFNIGLKRYESGNMLTMKN